MFYCPTHSTIIVKTKNVWFIENGETSGSKASGNVEIKEVRIQVPLTSTSTIIIYNIRLLSNHIFINVFKNKEISNIFSFLIKIIYIEQIVR